MDPNISGRHVLKPRLRKPAQKSPTPAKDTPATVHTLEEATCANTRFLLSFALTDLFAGPGLSTPGRHKRPSEQGHGQDDHYHATSSRPAKRYQVDVALGHQLRFQESQIRMANPRHPSHQLQRARVFNNSSALRRQQSWRPVFKRDQITPSNEAFVAQRFSEITSMTPSPRSGFETFHELEQSCSEVSQEERQVPAKNPQVAEEGHLDVVKRGHLDTSWYYHPAVYEGWDTPDRSYLQQSRSTIQHVLASANKISGIINPISLEGMAKAGIKRRGRPTMPKGLAHEYGRKGGRFDPPAHHILAGKHFIRNARAAKYAGLKTLRPPRSERFSNTKGFGRPAPESIRFADPHPPTSPHEADFVPSALVQHDRRWAPYPREVPQKVYHPTRPSPLQAFTAAAAEEREICWGVKSDAQGGVDPGPGACQL
ncbi:MAG: hypothetical protein M1831_000090 [Alyxoria varia]|nr:MAG: hypothetical protein M1831_000090 [Alyxoria varia]